MTTLGTLERYSHFHPSPLTIQQFMEFGKTAKEKNSAIFLRKELPLRLAIITKEMDLLPQKLLDTPSISSLQVLIKLGCQGDIFFPQELFCRSFEQLLLFDSAELDEGTLRNFCSALETMKKDNKDVVWQMAKVGRFSFLLTGNSFCLRVSLSSTTKSMFSSTWMFPSSTSWTGSTCPSSPSGCSSTSTSCFSPLALTRRPSG